MTEKEYRDYLKSKKVTSVDNYVNGMKRLLKGMLDKSPHGNVVDPFQAFTNLKDLSDFLNDFIKRGTACQSLLTDLLTKSGKLGSAALGHYIEKLQNEDLSNPDNDDKIKAEIYKLRKRYNQPQSTTSSNGSDTQVESPSAIGVTISSTPQEINNEKWSSQIIFYGAPGTGKSTKIKEHLSGVNKDCIFRTTFHPDCDYSSFVGSLKPKMKTETNGNNDNSGKEYISYQFVPGVFSNAYAKAWKNKDENVYLIIEEINRGNCATIFGDIFQLLDRKDGVSEYPIDAEPDLSDFLRKTIPERNTSEQNKPIKLQLPQNLYIWATMNTSDQSLFPIDAAFKRRWQMRYVKNKKRPSGSIEINKNFYDLNNIIESINKILKDAHLDDKEIGYYFLKDDELNAECLVGKLIHYLYHDVYKPFGKPVAFKNHSFNDLFTDDGEIDEKKLEGLLLALNIPAPRESINSAPTSDMPNDSSNNQADSRAASNSGEDE